MPPEDIALSRAEESDAVHVSGLARQVLTSLQARAGRAQALPPICPVALQKTLAAVLDPAPFEPGALISRLLADGVTSADLSDRIIPEAARHLGVCWCDSTLGFAKVTVSAGRLQEMLGCLMLANDFPEAWGCRTGGILVLSMRGDQHTMGWKVLTVQLRRRGYCAHGAPGVTAAEAAELIAQASYDLVLLSASRGCAPDWIGRLAERVRADGGTVPPIVLGGLVSHDLDQASLPPEVVALTSSLDAALSHRRRRRSAHAVRAW